MGARRDKTIHDDDILYRAIISLPQQPAVIRASSVGLFANEMSRGAMSGIMQSQWFDVPVISCVPMTRISVEGINLPSSAQNSQCPHSVSRATCAPAEGEVSLIVQPADPTLHP